MVNKSLDATDSAGLDAAKDQDATLTREERLAAELRRNLLKRKVQSRGRSEAQSNSGGDGDKDRGSGA